MKKFEQVANQVCGSYTFNSFFDSGNLGKVELVRTTADCEYACSRNSMDFHKMHQLSPRLMMQFKVLSFFHLFINYQL